MHNMPLTLDTMPHSISKKAFWFMGQMVAHGWSKVALWQGQDLTTYSYLIERHELQETSG